MISEGTWWISSKTDLRWKVSGQGNVGGFVKPNEVDAVIALLKEKYGDPPTDPTWHYMKD